MHELSIVESILAIALSAAEDRRVTAINLRIGDLSSFVNDSMQFYFAILSRGTPAESATLQIQRVPGTLTCAACGGQFKAHAPLCASCPTCGSSQLRVTGGRELRVESIEIE